MVFDLTQRNGAGLICNWQVDPEWHVDDPAGVLRIKESSHPFFLRVEVEHKGHFELQGTIDGIDSNVLKVSSVANGTWEARTARWGCPSPRGWRCAGTARGYW